MAQDYIFIDFETFSMLDLEEVGTDRYAKDPSTGISMLGWAMNADEVEVWLPHISVPPKKLIDALRNPDVIKIAWNVSFEFNIIKYVMGPTYVDGGLDIPIEQWRDPMILSHHLSLPGKLESAANILKMAQKKDERGKQLMKLFCQPASRGGEQTLFGIAPPLFRTQESHPRDFAEYVEYCKQDVRAERDLWFRMSKIPMPATEWQGWFLNQKINSFGMPGNRARAEKSLRLINRFMDEQRCRLKELTGLSNTNSPSQMKAWAASRGYPWNSMRANYIQAELDNPQSPITPECREALKIRATCTKSSYKKLERFLSVLSSDNRLRNQFRYMGAARTGRWAGGDVQVQNLPRGLSTVKKRLTLALELIDNEDYEGIVREFTNTADPKKSVTVAEFVITLMRSLFEAPSGKKIVVADLSAIENRVLGWAAGCWPILEVFTKSKEEGGDPYLSFGQRLFNKTYAEMWSSYVSGNEEERQNSKPAVLGAGYGLGGGNLIKNEFGDMVRGGLWGYAKNVCGVDMPKDLAHKAVEIFRNSYPEVVRFWADLEEAFKQVLTRGGVVKVGEVTWDKDLREWVKHPTSLGCVLTFTRIPMEGGGYIVRMGLPSGRGLHYVNATIDADQKVSNRTGRTYTSYQIRYDGIEHSATQGADGATAKKRQKWGRVKTYGGKICENAIQAIARDILLYGMVLADRMGFSIWGLFHDELATEINNSPFSLCIADLVWCMSQVPEWAPGLLLGAEGFEGSVYRKG